jgi:hypothetical protein
MKRIWLIGLVLALMLCATAQAEALPQTIQRDVPLEGIDETRTYTLVEDAQGRFSIYIDEGFYEAVPTEDGMTIQQKGGGAQLVLTYGQGDPAALRQQAITPEIRNNGALWEEDFDTQNEACGTVPADGCGAVYTQGGLTYSLYWFDAGGGNVLKAEYALSVEEQEGHGVRMWDMLETLVL